MKPFFDTVGEQVEAFASQVGDEIDSMIGQPMDVRGVSGRELVTYVNSVTPQEMDMLVQEFGEKDMNYLIWQAYKAEKRLKNG